MVILECMDGKDLLTDYLSLRDELSSLPLTVKPDEHMWKDAKKLHQEILRRLEKSKDSPPSSLE